MDNCVQKSGQVTPGHTASWTTNGVIQDSGLFPPLSNLGLITRSQIATTDITATSIVVSGYTTPGDLGAGAVYTSQGATSSSPAAIQSSTGTWFQLVVDGFVNIGWFGAAGQGLVDLNVAMTSGHNVLTTTTSPGPFTEAMIGRNVTVSNAASAANPGGSATGTITGFNNSQSVNVSFTCTNTVSGVKAMVYIQDDTPAIIAAISAMESAGGGVVQIPAGNFFVQPQSAIATQCFNITSSNIKIVGSGRNISTLIFCVYPMLDPITNWQIVSAAVLRGFGFAITPQSSSTPLANTLFQDFTFNGNSSYTGDNTYPANTTTGDGWDITNKCIYCNPSAGHLRDNTWHLRIHFTKWRGEIIYGGGTPSALGSEYIYDCEIDTTNGDCIATSSTLYAKRNHVHTAGGAGFDDITGYTQITNNYIHDCLLDGINVTANLSYAINSVVGAIITNNYFQNCQRTGITLHSSVNSQIAYNVLVDCAWSASNSSSILINQTGSGTTQGIHVTDNEIWANAEDLNIGIILSNSATTFDDIEVIRNRVGVTSVGVSNGITFTSPISLGGTITNAVIHSPYAKNTTYNYSQSAYAYETLITTTSATIVAKQRPAIAGLFAVDIYYRVVTATTNVTITLTWYDATGTQQTAALLPLTSTATGSYQVSRQIIGAQGATESQYIDVTVTAGTANQVYASASIKEAWA